ncbi:Copia protein, partial [Mucuna pruriens]
MYLRLSVTSLTKGLNMYLLATTQSLKLIGFFSLKLKNSHNDLKTNQNIELELEHIVYHPPIRGTRLLFDIYQRSNIAVYNIVMYESVNFEEVTMEEKLLATMQEELSMIERNQTWEVVPRPHVRNFIRLKWMFRTKFNLNGSINKHKARLVVKDNSQIFGIDYSDTFAPVARHDTIRLLLIIVAQKGWQVFHMDVKSIFLNDLKQAPRVWYNRINGHSLHLSFQKSLSEATLYVKCVGSDILIISLYVDDLLITRSNLAPIKSLNHSKENEIFVCQKKYAKKILKKFQLDKCKVMNILMNQKEKFIKEDGADKVNEAHFRSVIGCLMYLTSTRSNILFSVRFVSRFMHCASELHLKAAKRIVRYIKGTVNYGVKYYKVQDFKLSSFSYSDWASSLDDMKNTSGYCFGIGSNSTVEAKFVATTVVVNQAIWLRNILANFGLKQDQSTKNFVDNQAAISISYNLVFHRKTKHFNVKLFYLREMQEDGDVSLVYCKTKDQVVDMFTKSFSLSKFEFLRKKLGVCSLQGKEEH